MLILGEIADKMPTVPELWGQMFCVTLFFFALGVGHRWAGIAALCLSLTFSLWWAWASYTEAYHESISDLIQSEMGDRWIRHSIISAFLPGISIATLVTTQQYLKHRRKNFAP